MEHYKTINPPSLKLRRVNPKIEVMKRDSLHQQCMQLYKQMLQQIAGCECIACGEAKWIELGKANVIQSWFRVERMADGYQFVSDEEEVCFLKVLKSKLAGWGNFLHYYMDPVIAAG